jgi:hypothetical protein
VENWYFGGERGNMCRVFMMRDGDTYSLNIDCNYGDYSLGGIKGLKRGEADRMLKWAIEVIKGKGCGEVERVGVVSVITLTSPDKQTDKRFTYNVYKSHGKKAFYVKVLTGQNNTKDYTYIGFLSNKEGVPTYTHGGEAIGSGADSVTFFSNIINIIKPWYLTLVDGKLNRTDSIYRATRFSDEYLATQYANASKISDFTIIQQQLTKDGKALNFIQKNIASKQYEIWGTTHCCRCGRLLTVTESIERRMGVKCASMWDKGNHRIYM